MDEWSELPLFPLNTVLFPGMVLPLHIFEERYKLMIGRCLEEGRSFGVVLIREGKEAHGQAIPYEVGTTAEIAGVSRLEDGRMNIATVGSQRFRLRGIQSDLPYLVGNAEPWPLAEEDTREARRIASQVWPLLQEYLGLLAQAQGDEIAIEEVPTQPRALALLAAIALQLPMAQKQYLLDQPTVTEMLAAQHSLLRREQALLEHIIRTQGEQWEGGYSGFLSTN